MPRLSTITSSLPKKSSSKLISFKNQHPAMATMTMQEFFYGDQLPATTSSQVTLMYSLGIHNHADQSRPNSSSYSRRINSPPSFELFVPMCCTTCESQVRDALLDLEGVCDVVSEPENQRVVVSGYALPKQALKQARRVNKNAALWSDQTSTTRDVNYKNESIVHSEKLYHHRH